MKRIIRKFSLIMAAVLFCGAVSPAFSAEATGADRPVIGVEHEGPIKVVFQITGDAMSEGVNKDLLTLRKFRTGYLKAGIHASNLQIVAVLHGAAADHVLTDEAWNAHRGETGGNPNRELLSELSQDGVRVELCDARRLINGWEKSDIHRDVHLVSNAYQRLVDLQLRGYAYIKL